MKLLSNRELSLFILSFLIFPKPPPYTTPLPVYYPRPVLGGGDSSYRPLPPVAI
jgi:hypothetical protein